MESRRHLPQLPLHLKAVNAEFELRKQINQLKKRGTHGVDNKRSPNMLIIKIFSYFSHIHNKGQTIHSGFPKYLYMAFPVDFQ